MTATNFSQRRIDMSLRVSEIGSAAVIFVLASSALHLPFAVKALAYLSLIGSIFFLYRNRTQDEYLLKHWNAGASAGFFAVCLWSWLAPFLVGMWNGFHHNPRETSPIGDIMDVVLLIALASFFLAFQLNRWRNR